jgi:hypothetical protein
MDNPSFTKTDLDKLLKMKVHLEPEPVNILAR